MVPVERLYQLAVTIDSIKLFLELMGRTYIVIVQINISFHWKTTSGAYVY